MQLIRFVCMKTHGAYMLLFGCPSPSLYISAHFKRRTYRKLNAIRSIDTVFAGGDVAVVSKHRSVFWCLGRRQTTVTDSPV